MYLVCLCSCTLMKLSPAIRHISCSTSVFADVGMLSLRARATNDQRQMYNLSFIFRVHTILKYVFFIFLLLVYNADQNVWLSVTTLSRTKSDIKSQESAKLSLVECEIYL